jgi:hypothetical protein
LNPGRGARRASTVAGALLLVAAGLCRAQTRASIEVGGAGARPIGRTSVYSELMLGTLQATSGRVGFAASGAIARLDAREWATYGTAIGVLDVAPNAPLDASIAAGGGRQTYPGFDPSTFGLAGLRLGFRGRWRPALDGSYARHWREGLSGDAFTGTLSLFRALGPVELGLTVGPTFYSLPPLSGFPTGDPRTGEFIESSLTTTWTSPLIRISLTGGWRSAGAPEDHRRWAVGEVALRLVSRVELAGTAGWLPEDLGRGMAPGRFGRIGVRWRIAGPGPARPPRSAQRGPPAVGVAEAGDGGRRVTIRAAGAEELFLRGDFTGWEPVRLTRTSEGTWEAVVPLPEGTHRLQFSRDGSRWEPLPGLPLAADEFGGAVSVLLVP